MKRLWLGVGVLIVLLGVGIWAMEYAQKMHGQLSEVLEEASRAAMVGDWQQVTEKEAQARKKWEKGWGITAALSDHTELDEIDAGFARLEVYCRDRHGTDFAAESAALARQVAALGEGHRLSWQNLF